MLAQLIWERVSEGKGAGGESARRRDGPRAVGESETEDNDKLAGTCGA